ncbi:hypothetical protein T484DRAFT_1883794 [Baffinella frigidus]|nr:hypothetical protein T484DRAFT_1883794 [Cryptophyta sp. CCMP2293]
MMLPVMGMMAATSLAAGGADMLAAKAQSDMRLVKEKRKLEWEEVKKAEKLAWKYTLDMNELRRRWFMIDKKRVYVDEMAKQLTLLAEGAALLAGFQMMMFYELQLAPVDEHLYQDALLAIWGASCLFNISLCLCVMVVSALGMFTVLKASSIETPRHGRRALAWAPSSSSVLYSLDGARPEGLIMDNRQVHHFWKARWDQRFRRLIVCFSVAGPIFFFTLALSSVVKFYQKPVSGWTGFGVGVLGMAVWFRSQRSIVPHLTFRPDVEPDGESWFLNKCEKHGRRARGRSGGRRGSHSSSVALQEQGAHERTLGAPSLLSAPNSPRVGTVLSPDGALSRSASAGGFFPGGAAARARELHLVGGGHTGGPAGGQTAAGGHGASGGGGASGGSGAVPNNNWAVPSEAGTSAVRLGLEDSTLAGAMESGVERVISEAGASGEVEGRVREDLGRGDLSPGVHGDEAQGRGLLGRLMTRWGGVLSVT